MDRAPGRHRKRPTLLIRPGQADEARRLVGAEVVAGAVLGGKDDEGVAARVQAVVARVVDQGEARCHLRAPPRAAGDRAGAHGREGLGLTAKQALALLGVLERIAAGYVEDDELGHRRRGVAGATATAATAAARRARAGR